jgi:hypothetical protein
LLKKFISLITILSHRMWIIFLLLIRVKLPEYRKKRLMILGVIKAAKRVGCDLFLEEKYSYLKRISGT